MMTDFLNSTMIINLLIAMGLGMALGVERFIAHKTAGMRTYTLVSMGSALFVIISQLVVVQFSQTVMFDPLRVAAQVIAAAGFLGVGAIFHNDQRVSGITTATGLWVAAGIGMAAGFGFFKLAIVITILALFTFIVLWSIEKIIQKVSTTPNEDVQ